MMVPMRRRCHPEAGFTLIETIVALALMGLVLSALASITAEWLPNWNHGVDRIQRSEVIGIALQRIGAERAGYANAAIPIVAVLMSTCFEGLRWHAATACGIFLCVAGNFLVLRRPARPGA